MTDKNFDPLALRLKKKIYDSPKGKIRLNVLFHDLMTALPGLSGPPLRILDAGGGMGPVARKLAALGHEVVLCDISSSMLALGRKLNEEAGVSGKIEMIHCSIQDLPREVEGVFDLVMAHGVLEWMARPGEGMEILAPFVREGGAFSLLVYNKARLILKAGILGNLYKIQEGDYVPSHKKKALTPTHPLDHDEVEHVLRALGFSRVSKAGVRIFLDMIRNKEAFEEQMERLEAVEKRFSRQEPFASLGQHTHLVMRKDKG